VRHDTFRDLIAGQGTNGKITSQKDD
jgi:hypothetical protein